MRDIKYAIRRLRGSPGFTTAAIVTLAITIGATASVFGVVNGVLFRAFPYHDPDRVLTIWESNTVRQLPQVTVSPANYLDYLAQNRSFTSLAATRYAQVTVIGAQESERVASLAVTPSYFSVLGVTPALGRPLAVDSSGPAEVVIGYGYWQRRFGGTSSVLGKKLILDDHPYKIVGVMPAGLPGETELWTRLSLQASDLAHRDWHYLSAYGRLRPGVSAESGRRELETIAARLAQTYPQADANWSVVTVPLLDQLVGSVRPALIMLLAAAGCVLLIGVANLANLFLARHLAREREIAVRAALGATRGRLANELLIEAAVLGLTGGAIGVGVAVVGTRLLRALAPSTLPRLSQVGVDGQVVAFCALTSITAVLMFGVLPAWHASRGDLASVMGEGGRSTGSARRHRIQDALVVLQVAVALILLTGAGLLVETFGHFRRMDLGFRPEGVLTAEVAIPDERYPTQDRKVAFAASVVQQLGRQPGVAAAATSTTLPGSASLRLAFNVVGESVDDADNEPTARPVWISPDYFRAMGIALRRGRGILAGDDRRAVKVAVIDQLFARRSFGDRNPIGRRLALIGPDMDTVEIVGVVTTVKQGGLVPEDLPWIYLSMAQVPFSMDITYVALRASGDPGAQAGALTRVVANLDRTVPVFDVKPMNERVTESVDTTRFSTFLASLFAMVALVLGVIGIYSVLAYVVGQRKREIAIRLALGASRTHVMGNVFRHALTLTGIGLVLGWGVSWWLTRALAALFIDVSPHDPGIFLGAAATLVLLALAAASVPSFRTTRINPVLALNST